MTSEGLAPYRVRVGYFGASVAGPAHRAAGKPNEDCWLGASGAFGSLIVVSDGLGSRSRARHGASKACSAAFRAVRAWHKDGHAAVSDLVARIESLWVEEIAPFGRSDCAATCLFALARRDGGACVGALGDGMAAVRKFGLIERVERPRGSLFANETQSLGSGGDWSVRTFEPAEVDLIVLASDGVSEDLRPDRLDQFFGWLEEDIAPLPPPRRWHSLGRELNQWPTPRHLDDKTIAVLTWPRLGME